MSLMGSLPIFLVVLTILTFITSYIIAVLRGDVSAAFPYISDTGAKRPESCIFGQFLNISAFLALCTMFFHYKSVETRVGDVNEDPWIRRLNKSSLAVGVASSLGVSIVANFQEVTIVEKVHYTGAILTFVCGIVYCFLVSALSYRMYPCFTGLGICRLRLIIASASVTVMLIAVVSGSYAFNEWNESGHSHGRSKWSSGDPGYAAHIVSTAGEWITGFVFFTFFLTYVKELNKFKLEIKARPAYRHLDDSFEAMRDPTERTRLIL